MTSTTDLILAYLNIWNERDATARLAQMTTTLTEDATYTDPDYAELRGHTELSEAISQAHEKLGDLRFTLDTLIGTHHNRALFTWRLGEVATGYDIIELTENQ